MGNFASGIRHISNNRGRGRGVNKPTASKDFPAISGCCYICKGKGERLTQQIDFSAGPTQDNKPQMETVSDICYKCNGSGVYPDYGDIEATQ